MKLNKKKITKWSIRGGLFTLVAAGALVATYALTPARKRFVTVENNQPETGELSYFNKFVSKLTGIASGEEELGLKATLNNFEVSYPSKDGLLNNSLKIQGDLNLLMRSIDDMDFSLDANVNYNNKNVDFAIGLIESDFYFALQDFRIKSSYTSTIEALQYIYECFFDPENPDGLGIDLNLDRFIDEQIGGLDVGSLTSSLGGVSLPVTTETEVDGLIYIDLTMDDINIDIVIDKETLALKSVDLGTIKVGDVTIKGSLACEVIDHVIKLDDPSYPHQRGEYVEVISYLPWVDDLLDLFKTRKLGLDFNAQVSLDNADSTTSTLLDLATSINLDASQLIDFTNIVIGGDDPDVGRPEAIRPNRAEESDGDIFDTISKLEFGVDASLKGQEDEEYSNIDLSYFESAGYLTLNENASNEAVMRAKIDNATLSTLAKQIPDMVSSLMEEPATKSALINKAEAENTTSGLFNFLTSSELINAINNGDYSGIIDILKSITNTDEGIQITLDLSSLGLGDNAEVSIELTCDDEASTQILNIDVSEVEIGSANLDVQIATDDFSDVKINHIKEFKDQYDDMSFVPDVVGQVSDILDTKEGLITLEGSVLDNQNEGIAINGKAQFDYGEKIGYGGINIRQYSSELVNANKYMDHNILFDIDNSGSAYSERNMHFVYNTNLKAKITIQTVLDIFDLVKELLNSDDERFTKFTDSLTEMLLSGSLANVIAAKDYLELTKASYLKSVSQSNGGNTINVVIAGAALGLESDITVRVNFKTVNEQKKLASIELVNFKLGEKAINMKIGIDDFDQSYVSPVNKAENFMDFSQVKVLLDFGIYTTKLNYYHLTASVNLKISVLKALDFDLDFHIYVDGKTTKVYGLIPNVPYVVGLSNDALTDVSSELAFEPTDDIKGLFHIVRNEDHTIGKDEVNYYQADTDSFLENILIYLVVDMLDVRSTLVENLNSLTLSSEKTADPDYSNLFQEDGFKYSHNTETGVNTWEIGLNMGSLLGNSSLQGLNITLNGKDEAKSGLFTDAHVEMQIVTIVKAIADIELVNPSFADKGWPSTIETKYNKVLNWYHSMTQANKDRFDAEFKNQPLKTWRVVEQKNYF